MEPCLRSIFALQPTFELPTIDVVGCGGTIGNLLRFAGSQTKPFRFDVDVIGETIFFVRRENSPTELIKDVRGYGHTFPESYTTWDSDVRSSVSHQRIISYDFGELRLLVRTETDAYVKSPTNTKIKSLASQYNLEDAMKKTSVSNSSPSGSQKLQLKMQGYVHICPHFSILESSCWGTMQELQHPFPKKKTFRLILLPPRLPNSM
jgi:hypothetical protein